MVSMAELLTQIFQVLRAVGSGSSRRFVPVIFVLATEAPYERYALHFSFKIHQCRNFNLSYLTPTIYPQDTQFRRRQAPSSDCNDRANSLFSTIHDRAVEFHYVTEWLYTCLHLSAEIHTLEGHSLITSVIRKNISQFKWERRLWCYFRVSYTVLYLLPAHPTLLDLILFGWSMRWAGHVAWWEARQAHTGFRWGNVRKGDDLEGTVLDGRIKLKWIFKK